MNFLAGHMLRSKSRYSALDETAVMGAACRHECPIPCFFSLKHGERCVYVCVYMYNYVFIGNQRGGGKYQPTSGGCV